MFEFTHQNIDVIKCEPLSQVPKFLKGSPCVENENALVYLLLNEENKLVYVGETTNIEKRLKSHQKDELKANLTTCILIKNDKFHVSASKDLEAHLIHKLRLCENMKVVNRRCGSLHKQYPHKAAVINGALPIILEKLQPLIPISAVLPSKKGCTSVKGRKVHPSSKTGLPINGHVSEKTTPASFLAFTCLSPGQLDNVIYILQELAGKQKSTIIIHGGPGTGKTVIATILTRLLMQGMTLELQKAFGSRAPIAAALLREIKQQYPFPRFALVQPISAARATLQKQFAVIEGLKASLVIGPAEVVKHKYDFVLVDEAHRLRRRVQLGSYFFKFDEASRRLGLDPVTHSELDWIKMQARHTILFYDRHQSIRPSDVRESEFRHIAASPHILQLELHQQLRAIGGDAYIAFLQSLFNRGRLYPQPYSGFKYDLRLFTSLSGMVRKIKRKEKEHTLCRLVAGYAWPWTTKNNPAGYDIRIGNTKLRWNATVENWIHSANAINEVGSIHTVQGYDLNYAGVIFGHDIGYDPKDRRIIIRKEHYHDRLGKSASTPAQLHQYICNIYLTLMQRGRLGTFVYVCDPELRAYFARLFPPQGQ